MGVISRLVAVVTLTTVLSVAGLAHANVVLIEPDDYAIGADISNAIPGVTLSTWSSLGNGYFDYSPVFVGGTPNGCIDDPYNCRAVTGSQYLEGPGFISERWSITGATNCFLDPDVRAGTATCGYYPDWQYTLNALIVAFDQPTDFFEITGTWWADHVEAVAFDANFNLIYGVTEGILDTSRCYFSPASSTDLCANAYSISAETASISYVLAGSWAGIAFLDTIRYNAPSVRGVPEPSTLALFGLGLLGLGFRRRKLN